MAYTLQNHLMYPRRTVHKSQVVAGSLDHGTSCTDCSLTLRLSFARLQEPGEGQKARVGLGLLCQEYKSSMAVVTASTSSSSTSSSKYVKKGRRKAPSPNSVLDRRALQQALEEKEGYTAVQYVHLGAFSLNPTARYLVYVYVSVTKS
jgi:hypothetical protein